MLIENFEEIVKLDEAIDAVLSALDGIAPDSPEYAAMADNLTKLIKNKQIIAELKLKSLDTLNKKEADDSNTNNKAYELDLKAREHELKTRELTLKELESTTASALKTRELDLKEEEAKKPDRVSKETLAVIGANLAGIIVILGYEKANVIASKAFSLIMKR